LVPTSDDDIYFYENDIKILKVLGYTVIERDDLENDYSLRNMYSDYLKNIKLDTMISYIPYTLIIWN
jgi:hypothetical protein